MEYVRHCDDCGDRLHAVGQYCCYRYFQPAVADPPGDELCECDPDDECRYYYGCLSFPAVREFWCLSGIHDGCVGAYHVLYALCGAECYATPEKDEPEAQAAIFDDEGGLFPIETPEEWELVEEVFQSFVSEEDEDETEYCEGEDEDCNS